MIPDSLKQLLSHVDGHQRATWEGRDVALFNMAWGKWSLACKAHRCCTFSQQATLAGYG